MRQGGRESPRGYPQGKEGSEGALGMGPAATKGARGREREAALNPDPTQPWVPCATTHTPGT